MVLQFYYHPQSPPSQIVWMVLKELGIEHEEKVIDLWNGEHKEPEFLAVNSFGKVPAIKLGNFALAESRAIALYLCKKYEKSDKKRKLYPTELEEQAKVNMAIFVDLDNFYQVAKYMNMPAVFEGTGKGPLDEYLPKAKSALSNMETLLGQKRYMTGDHLTLVDFFALNATGLLAMGGFDGWSEFPRVEKWKSTMSQLPYFDECHTKPFERNSHLFMVKNKEIDVK